MRARVRTVVAGVSALASFVALLAGARGASATATVEWAPPRLVDATAPFGHVPRFTDVACPSVSFCAGVDYRGEVAVSSDPAASAPSWSATRLFGYGLQTVSCPEPGKCIVVGPSATIWTTGEAAAAPASWRPTSLAQGPGPTTLSDVSCASDRMCAIAAISYSGSERTVQALISVDPFGATPHWMAAPISDPVFYPSKIRCPTEQRCIATDGNRTMILSVDSAGNGTWRPGSGRPTVAEASLTGWSCPTASFCVAVDSKGDATAGRYSESSGTFSLTHTKVDPLPLTGVSCPSESFCLVVDNGGNVTSSRDPADATPTWSAPLALDPQAGSVLPGGGPVLAEGLEASNGGQSLTVACPGTERCVALDTYGNELIGGPPIAQTAGWRRATALAPQSGIQAIACPTAHLCAAIDDASRVISSQTPGSGSSTWGAAAMSNLADSYFPWGIACSDRPLCVAWDRSYKCCHVQAQQMVASVHPDGGGSSWRPIDGGAFFGGLLESEATSCPWRGLCLTFRSRRRQPPGVIVTEAPAHHRHRPRQFIPLYGETSCPAARLCLSVAADGEERADAKSGLIQISTAPASGRWKTRHIAPRPLGGISCPSTGLCFAFDDNGDVLWSNHPRGGAWRKARAAAAPLTALACPSASLCVGIDSSNEVVWSTSPLGGASAWKSELLETDGSLTAVACPSRRACLVADTAGRLVLGVRRGR
jgi:hypothetical protein